jgi:MerR family transcriptional regulator, copper efflux regulator
MGLLTIGQIAKRSGVGVETVRFYEHEGLIEDPPRRTSGYRQYSPDVIARIKFIKRAKELGFSLKEIRELLALRSDPKTTCSDIKQRAQAKLKDIEERLRDLKKMRDAISQLAAACDGSSPINECPILDALVVEEENNGNEGCRAHK